MEDKIKTLDEVVDEWYDDAPIIDTESDSTEVFIAMTFEQFAKDMYYENRNERRDYGEKLYDTFEDYFENNKSF